MKKEQHQQIIDVMDSIHGWTTEMQLGLAYQIIGNLEREERARNAAPGNAERLIGLGRGSGPILTDDDVERVLSERGSAGRG